MTSGPTAAEPPSATRLGVLGWPVAHSLSPAMQNAALAAAGLPGWRYQLLPAPPERFAEIVAALPDAGFAGANVTIPHKSAALAIATDPSERARAIGAANTLVFGAAGAGAAGDRSRVAADNTDAPALTASLRTRDRALPGAALVLGAGGSARAAVWALRDAGVADVAIWNRTPERAASLAASFGARAVTGAEPAPLLVNCTAAGLDGGDPFGQLPLDAAGLAGYATVVDYVYTPRGTRLIDAARAAGCATVDGLELLVAQGALAFELFTGRPAPVEAMRAAARAAV